MALLNTFTYSYSFHSNTLLKYCDTELTDSVPFLPTSRWTGTAELVPHLYVPTTFILWLLTCWHCRERIHISRYAVRAGHEKFDGLSSMTQLITKIMWGRIRWLLRTYWSHAHDVRTEIVPSVIVVTWKEMQARI